MNKQEILGNTMDLKDIILKGGGHKMAATMCLCVCKTIKPC